MPYKVKILKDATSIVDSLPEKQRMQIKTAIGALSADPFPADSETLTGYPGFRRQDVGEYRIVYRVDTAVQTPATPVYVLLVDKRNDDEVYKVVKRRHKGWSIQKLRDLFGVVLPAPAPKKKVDKAKRTKPKK